MASKSKQRFPIYIPTKGRYDSVITMRDLDKLGLHYYAVVEAPEYEQYVSVLGKDKVLVLDDKYKRDYELLDDLGLSKSTGPGPARNFAWAHSIANGDDWHWVMDDNIYGFDRFQNNLQLRLTTPKGIVSMEDFAIRYQNVAMAGPHYAMFLARKKKYPYPFTLNTRIYSCNFIRNSVPFRWRGRYNEDTILSLDMITEGWCTVLFNHVLCRKVGTQLVKGGNTKEFYSQEGTAPKSQILKDIYPRYTSLVTRYGRAHHYIDYQKHFSKYPRLRLAPDTKISKGKNNYGMRLKPKG